MKECVIAQDIIVFQFCGKAFVKWGFEKRAVAHILTYSWIHFLNVNTLFVKFRDGL